MNHLDTRLFSKLYSDLIQKINPVKNNINHDEFKELNHLSNRPTPFYINLEEDYKPKLTTVSSGDRKSFNEVFDKLNFK